MDWKWRRQQPNAAKAGRECGEVLLGHAKVCRFLEIVPNSQRLLFTKRLHGPLLNSFEGDVYMGQFLDKRLESVKGQQDIEAY